LFDSDREGREQEERLRTKWITRYKSAHSFSLLLGPAVGEGNDFAIEDLFPEAYYLAKAFESHKEKLRKSGVSEIKPIGAGLLRDRVQRGYEQAGIQFNKGSVAKLIRKDLASMTDLSNLDPRTVERVERLFAALNAELSKCAV